MEPEKKNGSEKPLEDICQEGRPNLQFNAARQLIYGSMKAIAFFLAVVEGAKWAQDDYVADEGALMKLGALAVLYVTIDYAQRHAVASYLRREFSYLEGKIEELKQQYAASNQEESKE